MIVTDAYGCVSDPSEPYYFIYTGMIEIAEGQKVSIYPNPFKGQFTLDYALPSASDVTSSMFNFFGQLITVIESEADKMSGNHRLVVDASRFGSGIYYLKIETGDYSIVKRIIHSN